MFKTFIFIAIGILSPLASVSSAQTLSEIESKYGKAIKVYEPRPGIMMHVSFDGNGEASEITLERKSVTPDTIYLDKGLPNDVIRDIVNDLVPQSKRGKSGPFSELLVVTGGSGTQTQDYGNVTITYYTRHGSSTGLVGVVIRWKNHNPTSFQTR